MAEGKSLKAIESNQDKTDSEPEPRRKLTRLSLTQQKKGRTR